MEGNLLDKNSRFGVKKIQWCPTGSMKMTHGTPTPRFPPPDVDVVGHTFFIFKLQCFHLVSVCSLEGFRRGQILDLLRLRFRFAVAFLLVMMKGIVSCLMGMEKIVRCVD